MILFGFYVLYAIQNIFDATFYGIGKTHYMLFESIVTNSIYYGIAFILYVTDIWNPTLTSIALLFGIGNAFDTIVSLAAYWYLLKKNHNVILLESNFKDYEMDVINEIIKEYDYKVLSFVFKGDNKILHQRFLKRLKRHIIFSKKKRMIRHTLV